MMTALTIYLILAVPGMIIVWACCVAAARADRR